MYGHYRKKQLLRSVEIVLFNPRTTWAQEKTAHVSSRIAQLHGKTTPVIPKLARVQEKPAPVIQKIARVQEKSAPVIQKIAQVQVKPAQAKEKSAQINQYLSKPELIESAVQKQDMVSIPHVLFLLF